MLMLLFCLSATRGYVFCLIMCVRFGHGWWRPEIHYKHERKSLSSRISQLIIRTYHSILMYCDI